MSVRIDEIGLKNIEIAIRNLGSSKTTTRGVTLTCPAITELRIVMKELKLITGGKPQDVFKEKVAVLTNINGIIIIPVHIHHYAKDANNIDRLLDLLCLLVSLNPCIIIGGDWNIHVDELERITKSYMNVYCSYPINDYGKKYDSGSNIGPQNFLLLHMNNKVIQKTRIHSRLWESICTSKSGKKLIQEVKDTANSVKKAKEEEEEAKAEKAKAKAEKAKAKEKVEKAKAKAELKIIQLVNTIFEKVHEGYSDHTTVKYVIERGVNDIITIYLSPGLWEETKGHVVYSVIITKKQVYDYIEPGANSKKKDKKVKKYLEDFLKKKFGPDIPKSKKEWAEQGLHNQLKRICQLQFEQSVRVLPWDNLNRAVITTEVGDRIPKYCTSRHYLNPPITDFV